MDQCKIPVDLSSMAINTALIMAEVLFMHTLAMKSAYFLAVCFEVLACVLASAGASKHQVLIAFMTGST